MRQVCPRCNLEMVDKIDTLSKGAVEVFEEQRARIAHLEEGLRKIIDTEDITADGEGTDYKSERIAMVDIAKEYLK